MLPPPNSLFDEENVANAGGASLDAGVEVGGAAAPD